MSAPRIEAAPIVVSDATALAVVGLTPRQFRAFVREHRLPAARVGRRTLVRADVVIAAIDRLAGATSTPVAAKWSEADIIARAVAR